MFEEFRAVSTGSANVRWFHELVDEPSTQEDGALGWFPAGAGFPKRALVIPGQRRPNVE